MHNDPARAWVDQGISLGSANRLREAVQAFRNALQFNANSTAAWFGLALSHEKLGEDDLAIQAYDSGLRLKPDFYDGWISKGQILQSKGRAPEALAAFDFALRLRPQEPHAWMKRGLALSAMGHRDEAVHAFSQFVTMDPNNAGGWLNLAMAEAKAGMFTQAYPHMMEAQRRVGAGPVRVPLSQHGADMANQIESQLDFLRAVVEEPKTSEQWLMRGTALSTFQSIAAAIEPLRHGLSRFPDDPQLVSMLATFLRWDRREPEARQVLEAALQRSPRQPRIWVEYAELLSAIGDFQGALVALDRAAALEPDSDATFLKRVDAVVKLGRKDEAISLLDEWLTRHPMSDAAWQKLGGLHLNESRFEQASAAYKRAASLGDAKRPPPEGSPVVAYKSGRPITFREAVDDAEFWILGVEEQYKKGKDEGALALTAQALVCDPRSARAWALRGYLLSRLRRLPEAKEALLKAVEFGPNDARTWMALAEAHVRERNRSAAETALSEAIRLDPSFKEAILLRADLRIDDSRFVEAISDYDATLRIDNRQFNAWFFRASALAHLGRLEEALQSYGYASSVKPNNGHAIARRARILRQLGRRTEALAMHEQGLRVEPRLGTGWWEYAITLGEADRLAEALRAADEAIRLDPAFCEGHRVRADLLRRGGRTQEAEAEAAKGAALKEGDPDLGHGGNV